MERRRGLFGLISVALLPLLAGLGSPAQATEQFLFGPAQYIRTSGLPNEFM